ncbi:hypothetical protein BT63DRAFT_227999 [Microthyrium microscopicum]|uniref:Uncharacterized protein n=1 Tax=Microthyrium microscopicum TaxID=703497 RepID=A0A6A6UCP8_9PEZI|nr:hypothetical protein BT63DRAFT_227999 [Microthyrium microscopicum]
MVLYKRRRNQCKETLTSHQSTHFQDGYHLGQRNPTCIHEVTPAANIPSLAGKLAHHWFICPRAARGVSRVSRSGGMLAHCCSSQIRKKSRKPRRGVDPKSPRDSIKGERARSACFNSVNVSERSGLTSATLIFTYFLSSRQLQALGCLLLCYL